MDEQKAWLGRGWAYPVQFDPISGAPELAEYETDIRQAIAIILSTARGERVMRPTFGCGIWDLPYDVMDTALLTRVETEVREALIAFEARIEVMSVQVHPEMASAEGKLRVELDYRVRRTNQTDNLVFPFYFREGGQGGALAERRR